MYNNKQHMTDSLQPKGNEPTGLWSFIKEYGLMYGCTLYKQYLADLESESKQESFEPRVVGALGLIRSNQMLGFTKSLGVVVKYIINRNTTKK